MITTAEHFRKPKKIPEIDRLTVDNRGKWNECGSLIAMVAQGPSRFIHIQKSYVFPKLLFTTYAHIIAK